MKHTLFTLLIALSMVITGSAYAQQEPGQLATQPAPMADPALTDPDLMVHDPNVKVTRTLERTTTKNYTITKCKLGHVGGRPYPTRTENVEGGVTVEKYVNDIKTDTHVVKPDPMLDGKPSEYANKKPYEYPFREYTTDDVGLNALGEMPTDVEIRDVGNFND